MLALPTILLSLSLLAFASPSRRQSGDNGSCKALQATCTANVKSDLSNVWSLKECIFGASCFSGQRPVDDFLAAVYSSLHNGQGTAPQSVNLPRVTSAVRLIFYLYLCQTLNCYSLCRSLMQFLLMVKISANRILLTAIIGIRSFFLFFWSSPNKKCDSSLDLSGGPYPTTPQVVIDDFQRLAVWYVSRNHCMAHSG